MLGEGLKTYSSGLKIRNINFGAPALGVFDLGVSDVVDSTGVPRSSDRGNPELRKHLKFDMRQTPFTDSPSRIQADAEDPKPMSEFERKRLANHYAELLSIVGAVRARYITEVRNQGNWMGEVAPLTSKETKEVLSGLFHLPDYLVHRANNSVEPFGVMPPALIIMSNAASGTLGALVGYLNKYGESAMKFVTPPSAKEMIKIAEEDPEAPMVGAKTVCVASPKLMHHFIGSVVHGPGSYYRDAFDLSEWVSADEYVNMVKFGDHSYEVSDLIGGLVRVDKKSYSNYLEARKSHKKKSVIERFQRIGVEYADKVGGELMSANLHLGRGIITRVLKPADVWTSEMQMPTLILRGS